MLHIDNKTETQKITQLKDYCIGLLGSGIVIFILFLITNNIY